MFQVTEVLKHVPFFQTLDADGINFIIERLKFKLFENNELICKAGDPGDKMFMIISGKVKVVVHSPQDGEENLIANLGVGDCFGEMALLTGEPRSADVVATEPSEMFILSQDDFDIVLRKFPSITLSLGKLMSRRLRDILQKTAEQVSDNPTFVKGEIADKSLIDVLKDCEKNSLNGKVVLNNSGEIGKLYYEKGVLQKVRLGDLPEDQALDAMLNWQDGMFIVEPSPFQMDDLAADKKIPVILIVNNSKIVQKLLKKACENLGYKVYAVETAAQTIDLVRSVNPNLVVCSLKLPDSTGVDLMRSLRKTSKMPILLLTDDSNKSMFESKFRDSSKIYFTNSQQINEVVKSVENALKKA